MDDTSQKPKKWLWAILLIGFSAVFLWLFLYPAEKGEGLTPRLVSAVWNLGHVGLFFVWAWILATGLSSWFRLRGLTLLLVSLLLSFVAGYLIEGAQFGSDRSASIDDVVLDVVGAFMALVLHPMCRAGVIQSVRTFLVLLALGLTAYAFYPASLLLADTYWQWRQFPVLLDFSTPLEMSRVNGTVDYELATREADAEQGLRVTFRMRRPSVVGFADLPSDWSGYRSLVVEVYNPDDAEMQLYARIQDQSHNKRHYDRYDDAFTVGPQRDTIVIDLHEVRESPGGRAMDMSAIDLVLFYTINLPRERVLWIDSVELAN